MVNIYFYWVNACLGAQGWGQLCFGGILETLKCLIIHWENIQRWFLRLRADIENKSGESEESKVILWYPWYGTGVQTFTLQIFRLNVEWTIWYICIYEDIFIYAVTKVIFIILMISISDQHNENTHHKYILSYFFQEGCSHPCTGTGPLPHDSSATIGR